MQNRIIKFEVSSEIAIVLFLLLSLAGCGSTNQQYFRSGIGVDLHTIDFDKATQLQNEYCEHLSIQAGLKNSFTKSPSNNCSNTAS